MHPVVKHDLAHPFSTARNVPDAGPHKMALASVAAPAHCTASLGAIQNFGGYLGGALAPAVSGFIVQATDSFVPALLVSAVIGLI